MPWKSCLTCTESVPHLHLKTQSDYVEQNSVEGSDNNVRNTLCRIVRHSTLWVRPEVVAQIQFLEWTGADHLRHTKFVALRDDKDPSKVVRET
jgi:ATP-dependent DNA ligase